MPELNNIPSETENINREVIKNFFNIWIVKEFISNDRLDIYYKTFLSKDGSFSIDKLESILKEIYTLISSYDVTSYRPNNIDKLSNNIINKILLSKIDDYDLGVGLSNEILEQIPGSNILHFVDEGMLTQKNCNTRVENIGIIKEGLTNYLEQLEIIGTKVNNITDTIVNKVIKILKKQK